MKRLARAGLCALLIGSLAVVNGAMDPARGARAEGTDSYIVVAENGLRVRERPDGNSKVLGKLAFKAQVQRIARSGKWFRVETPKGKTGWCYSGYLVRKNEVPVGLVSRGHGTSKKSVRVYAKPSLSARVLGKAKFGSSLTVLRRRNGWAYIMNKGGQTGYMLARYLNIK